MADKAVQTLATTPEGTFLLKATPQGKQLFVRRGPKKLETPLCPVDAAPDEELAFPSCSRDARVVAWVRPAAESAVEIRLLRGSAWEARQGENGGGDFYVNDLTVSPDGRWVVWSSGDGSRSDLVFILDTTSPDATPRTADVDFDAVRCLHWLAPDVLGFITDGDAWDMALQAARPSTNVKARLLRGEEEVQALQVSTGKPTRWPPETLGAEPRAGSPVPSAEGVQWITNLRRLDHSSFRSRLPIPFPIAKRWSAKLPRHFGDCSLVAGAGRVFGSAQGHGVFCLDLADGSLLWERKDLHEFDFVHYAGGRLLAQNQRVRHTVELDPEGKEAPKPLYEGSFSMVAIGDGFIGTLLAGKTQLRSVEDLRLLETPPDIEIRAVIGGLGLAYETSGLPKTIRAYDLTTGQMRWEEPLEERLDHAPFGIGGALFHFVAGNLVCRDLATGKPLWNTSVGQRRHWVDGTTLYVDPRPVDRWKGPQYTLTALEAETGKEIAGKGIRLSGLEWVAPLLGKKSIQHCGGKKGDDPLEAMRAILRERHHLCTARTVGLSPGAAWVELEMEGGDPRAMALGVFELGSGRLLASSPLNPNTDFLGFADNTALVAQGRTLTCFASAE